MQPPEKISPLERETRAGSGLPSPGAGFGLRLAAALALQIGIGSGAIAGDLLRNGATYGKANPVGAAPAISAAQDQARAASNDVLSKTTKALQAVQAMQQSAQKLSAGANNLGADPNHPGQILPNVPNGLVPGGLQIVGAPTGANAPTQSGRGGSVTVTVKQTSPQAILNWSSFNIGKNTTLYFNQTAGGANASQWIAFNKVSDPSGVPSQILGSIRAEGQVYVINQNGIIFGGTSQVNVHTLVASSLPINDGLIKRGLLNNPDAQFLFSALAQPAGSKGPTPAFTPPAAPNTADGKLGDVTVQAGAVLQSPVSDANVGGRIALIGPNVTNNGTISTPAGQTILAAGLQVGINSHPTSDPSLRGLDVFVGAVVDPSSKAAAYAGTATNSGYINAALGNVYITGKNVNQLGFIDSSTSVALNGRIDLLANYNAVSNVSFVARTDPSPSQEPFLFQSTGAVTLGPGSVMQILPDTSDASITPTVKNGISGLAIQSQINLQGLVIHMASDATILAPNATINVQAGQWRLLTNAANSGGNGASVLFLNSAGQIYLDSGATIDVSGSQDVSAPMSQNIIEAQLRGAELADSPLQRDGALRGQTITIDIRQAGTFNGIAWVGSPIGNLFGYASTVQQTAGELTINGGTVNFNAGSSVVMQKGVTVNVSGGWINYAGSMVQTTRVVTADGHILDISQATPDMVYAGIYTGLFTNNHPKWGVSNTYTVPWMLGKHYEPAYSYGGNGGSISITSPAVALDGDFMGNTITGPRQQNAAPVSSSFSLTFQNQQYLSTPVTGQFTFSPTPPAVTFQSKSSLAPADPFALDDSGNPLPLRADRLANVILSPELLTTDGFGNLTVDNSDGSIVIPSNVSLNAPPGGSVTLKGSNITVNGSITAPAGSISLTVTNVSPYTAALLQAEASNGGISTPAPDPTRGLLTLNSGASLDASGLIIDNRRGAPDPLTLPQGVNIISGGAVNTISTINGGSVILNTYSADLAKGSVIDVSGGVVASGTGKLKYGNGGSIVIKTGIDANLSILGGTLNLGAELLGYAGLSAKGGSLSIQAQQIEIGGSAIAFDTGTSTVIPTAAPLVLSPDFFSEGGFSSFTLTGLGTGLTSPAVYIEAGAKIAPVEENVVGVFNLPGQSTVVLRKVVEPVGMRSPVSLSFVAKGVTDSFSTNTLTLGNFVLDERASIHTDPLASVSVNAQTIAILGSIYAPGGTITLQGANKYPITSPMALPTVYLGPQSVLSTAGTTVFTPNAFGQRTGYVLPGGTISVSGNIVAMAGAVLDVSGSSDMLDVPPASLGLNATLSGPLTSPVIPLNSGINFTLYSREVVRTRVDSNGGTISLTGGEELFTDATLLGAAGGPTAAGGTLLISSGRFEGPNPVPSEINLVVSQNKRNIPVPSYFPAGQTAIGNAVVDAKGNVITGMGYFSADSFLSGGFDSLGLGGNVDFLGPVSITARNAIQVATGGYLYANSHVNLTAPYVALGTAFQTPFQPVQQAAPFVIGQTPYYFPPTYGAGVLTVHATYIDIGNLSLQGIGRATLVAAGGDIRGDGTLDIQGNITLQAAQIYPSTGVTFTIAAYDYTLNGVAQPGSVTIRQSGVAQLPLSAGGTLNIYASKIDQGGTLVAPFGAINLGWDGTGTAPVDNLAGPFSSTSGIGLNSTVHFPVTQQVILRGGSVTSVAGIDPVTGQEVTIPYGVNLNGTQWIDPSGVDITASGVPLKSINIQGQNVSTAPGSVVSIQGGGDLFSYRFVPGQGGSTDILASSNNFAVIPGYSSLLSPFAAYNQASLATNNFTNGSVSDLGYVNSKLKVGDQVYLDGSSGLPAGVYTLLPARYALLPGAVMVTPVSGAPIGTIQLPDGSAYVDGHLTNGLISASNQFTTRFQVTPQSVVNNRAQYDTFTANSFFPTAQADLNVTVTRLPIDAGHLVFEGMQGLSLQGQVLANSPSGGLGGLVDISTPLDIYITGSGSAPSGAVGLNSSLLSSYGAESLLIGGVRTLGSGTATVKVTTGNITVDNAGSPLSGPEIILTANNTLTLKPGAIIAQSGEMGESAATLYLNDSTQLATPGSTLSFVRGGTPITFPSGTPGNDKVTSTVAGVINNPDGTTTALAANTATTLTAGATVTLSAGGTLSFAAGGTGGAIPISLGDGTLLRVSSDANANIVRTNVASSTQPHMVIGAGASISGASITLDSTYATFLDPTATLSGNTINLNSGQISLSLDNPGLLQPTVGLILSGAALQSLQSAQSLSLLSYSSIDIYGTGSVGSSSLASLAMHAGEIRGFNANGGDVTFTAQSITLDNKAGNPGPGPINGLSGSLIFNASTIQLGVNQLQVDQYAGVVMNASGGVITQGVGGFSTQGTLTINTPLLTASAGATQSITAGGALVIQPFGGAASVSGGLGASLTLNGASITENSKITLPSGLLVLHALTGDVNVGGRLDVTGTSQSFYDLIKYTNAGQISLISDMGSVNLNQGGVVDVSASRNGGSAGTLVVQANSAAGTFNVAGTLLARSGRGGETGSFFLDAGTLPTLSAISTALDAGDFNQSRSIRVRNGDVTVNANVTAHTYNLSTDHGSITVNSTIDASGVTGGAITLSASGSIIISPTAVLTVAAQTFDSAGKGGEINLFAGSEINGVIDNTATLDIQTGSLINLSVGNYSNLATLPSGYQAAPLGAYTGTLHLRAPQNSTATDLQIAAINGTILNASSITVEGYKLYDLAGSGGVINTAVQNAVFSNGTAFAGNTASIFSRLTMNNPALANALAATATTANPVNAKILQIVPGAELINSTSGSATLPITLNASGSSMTFDSSVTLTFPSGTPSAADRVTFSVGGTVTVGGVTSPITANTAMTLQPGSVVTLASAGRVTFSAGSTAIPFTVATGASGSNLTPSGNTTITAGPNGSTVQLNATSSVLTLNTAGNTVTFANGLPGNDAVRFSSAGKVFSSTGVLLSNFAANATLNSASIPVGAMVQLTNAGSITFTSGTGGAIPIQVAATNTFNTTGTTTTTAAPSTGITLGNVASGTSADWDLSTFRFGTNLVPGVLTIRSNGNLVFLNSLSDGFTNTYTKDDGTVINSTTGKNSGYDAFVKTQNSLLPTNAQSWSYNLTAGADLGAADLQRVLSISHGGSLLLGRNMTAATLNSNAGTNGQTSKDLNPSATSTFYQVIRTGTGEINVAAANNVYLLNQFATIYSAGVLVTDPTLGGTFVTPTYFPINSTSQGRLGSAQENPSYQPQFTLAGGNIVITAQGDIAHKTVNSAGVLVADSEAELPTSWLYRRGYVDPATGLFGKARGGDIASTAWWVDFSNFFEGVGALGGGNVTLNAGGNVSNVDAVIPTNARMPGQTTGGQAIAPNSASLVQLGGGDLTVKAGNNIDAGVYYVERGHGILTAGGSIVTNSTRSPTLSTVYFTTQQGASVADSKSWLPTTLFLGEGSFDVSARGSVLLGPVANPFLLPEGYSNTFWYKTYFNTYGASDTVDVTSLGGTITLREVTTTPTSIAPVSILEAWYQNVLLFNTSNATRNNSNFMPWLRLDEDSVTAFNTVASIMPPTLRVTAFAGDINVVGNLTLYPSPTGTIDLAASGSINALQPNGVSLAINANLTPTTTWAGSIINLSDADPAAIANIASPFAYQSLTGTVTTGLTPINQSQNNFLTSINTFFGETGSYSGNAAAIQTKTTLHDSAILHLDDPNPVHIYSLGGNISGLTLFSGKATQVAAGQDITNVSFYIQNVNSTDISFISSGRDIITYDQNSPLQLAGLASGNALEALAYGTFVGLPQSTAAGDIQISGPGTLEVLAGRHLNLGNTGSPFTDGTGVGITSIGNSRNPALPFNGADLIIGAGLGPSFGLSGSQMDFTSFLSQYLTATAPSSTSGLTGGTYLSELAATLTTSTSGTLTLTPESVSQMTAEQQDALALQLLLIVLRDAGRSGDFATGYSAISTLFPKPNTTGDITVTGREIKTVNGGNLTIINPVGQITVGLPGTSAPAADQGIFTVDGGNLGIFAAGSTNVGISRVFTLHGGNIVIWSSTGDIDAGASAKTVTAAPPTRVLIDPQSADVQTDLGGLATGGGIGVLATVAGIPPGSVDLIAPVGTVNAGDAGIRATGSVNIAAAVVLNASNISAPSVSGVSSAPTVAAPNIAGLTSASSAAGAGSSAAAEAMKQNTAANQPPPEEAPSIITVEVLGYGGGDDE